MSDDLDLLEPYTPPVAIGFDLRPYQTACLAALKEGWKQFSRQLVVMEGGGGKTVVFSHAAKAEVEVGGRVLILAHTDELIDQAIEKLRRSTGLHAEKEKADEHASLLAPIVVASNQTLSRETRLLNFPDDHFTLVIQDEAHRSLAPSFLRVLNYFHFGVESLHEGWEAPAPGTPYRHKARISGWTATASRGDKRSLGEFYQHVAYEWDLLQAVRDGYLVRPIVKNIPIKLDMRGIKVSRSGGQGGDLDLGEVTTRITPFLREIAKQLAFHASTLKTVVFMPSVETARILSEALCEQGLAGGFVSGQCDDREEKIAAFRLAGPGTILCNALLLVEGFDVPDITGICLLRPTKIWNFYKQCLDTETEVLTINGWRKDILIGDLVAAFDVKTSEIKYIPASGIIRRKSEEEWCTLKSAQCDVRVTAGHRMLYDHKRKTGWKIKSAANLAALRDTNYMPCAGYYQSIGVRLTDDELRFVGWFMTDGNLHGTTKAITICQAEHQPWCQEIEKMLVGCGFKYGKSASWAKSQFKRNSRMVRYSVSRGSPRSTDKHLRGWVALEPWISKDFSFALMEVTPRQFAVLIQAIWMGDGSKAPRKFGEHRGYNITTGNQIFAERLQITAIRCGYRANVKRMIRDNPYWSIRISKRLFVRAGGKLPDRPSWKVEPATGEECWCVENELGTLITRRNGKVLIVGNCNLRGTRTLPGTIDGLESRDARLAAIARSAKPVFTILDFLWLSDRMDLICPFDLVTTKQGVKERMSVPEGGELDLVAAEILAEKDFLAALMKEAKRHAKKQSRVIDPIALAVTLGDAALATWEPLTAWDELPPTPNQLQFLSRQHIDVTNIKHRGLAQRLTFRVLQRLRSGLCSYEQIVFLSRMGIPEEKTVMLTRTQASATIEARKKELAARRG